MAYSYQFNGKNSLTADIPAFRVTEGWDVQIPFSVIGEAGDNHHLSLSAAEGSEVVEFVPHSSIHVIGIRFKAKFIKSTPIPPITEANQHIATQIEEIVDQILDAKQTDPNADTSNLENEVDKLVSELYDLTEDEIAIVEGSV